MTRGWIEGKRVKGGMREDEDDDETWWVGMVRIAPN